MSTISFDYQPRYSVSRPARPQLRLTRRGRAVIVLAVLAVVGVLAVAFGPSTIATRDAGQLPPVHTVTVQPGDTLWDIAAQANPHGNVRSTIDDILKINSLNTVSDVSLGDKIAVPVYSR